MEAGVWGEEAFLLAPVHLACKHGPRAFSPQRGPGHGDSVPFAGLAR
jgi:hypothetical protein